MDAFALKLRHIYVPFLAVTAGFALAYSLASWALLHRTRLVVVDEELTTFWLPAALAWIPALLWIWPRIKALRLEEINGGRFRDLYLLFAAATAIVPTVLGQMYLSRAAAGVTRLGEMSEISAARPTKYYVVDRPCLRREGARVHGSSELAGRGRDTLVLTFSVAVPFCRSSGDANAGPPPAWLGLTFRKSIPARGSDDMRAAAGREFAKESQESFDAMDLGAFTYLEAIGPGSRRRGFEAAIRKADADARGAAVLEPHHDPFEERAGNRGAWALGSFGIGAGIWLVLLAIPDVHVARLRRPVAGGGAAGTRAARWRAWLAPSAIVGTPGLALVNAIVFLVMVFAGLGVVGFQVDDVVRWGASSRALLDGAGVLRLVTSQFVHGGLAHVLGNLYGLLFGGMLLQSAIGGRRVVVAYLVAGIVGGVASAFVHPDVATVGASGSIFGLFGVLFGLLAARDERVLPAAKALLVNAGVYVGYNLLLGAVTPGVDNAAHVGGLLAGFALAPLLRARRVEPRR